MLSLLEHNYMPSINPGMFARIHINLKANIHGRDYCFLHLIDKKTETQIRDLFNFMQLVSDRAGHIRYSGCALTGHH